MKRYIFTSIFAFIAIFATLASCTDNEDYVVAEKAKATKILYPTSSDVVVLNKDLANVDAFTFIWEPADYSYQGVYNYVIQLTTENDTNFANAYNLATTTNTYYGVTNAVLNSVLLDDLQLSPGVYSNVLIRIKSYVGSQGDSEVAYSEPISLSVNPYIDYKTLYLVGSATAAGANNNNGNYPIFKDPTNDYKFSYTGKFVAGGFKLLGKLGADTPAYGKGASEGTLTNDSPSDITIPYDGIFTITVNLQNNEYTVEEWTGVPVTYTNIGLVGAFNGWGDNLPMVTQTFDAHIWKINTVTLPAGGDGLKFRENNSWDPPYSNWGGSVFPTGTGVASGSNIVANVAGDYEVWFNDYSKQYLFLKK